MSRSDSGTFQRDASALAHRVPDSTLKIIFGVALMILAAFLIFVPAPEDCEPGAREGALLLGLELLG